MANSKTFVLAVMAIVMTNILTVRAQFSGHPATGFNANIVQGVIPCKHSELYQLCSDPRICKDFQKGRDFCLFHNTAEEFRNYTQTDSENSSPEFTENHNDNTRRKSNVKSLANTLLRNSDNQIDSFNLVRHLISNKPRTPTVTQEKPALSVHKNTAAKQFYSPSTVQSKAKVASGKPTTTLDIHININTEPGHDDSHKALKQHETIKIPVQSQPQPSSIYQGNLKKPTRYDITPKKTISPLNADAKISLPDILKKGLRPQLVIQQSPGKVVHKENSNEDGFCGCIIMPNKPFNQY